MIGLYLQRVPLLLQTCFVECYKTCGAFRSYHERNKERKKILATAGEPATLPPKCIELPLHDSMSVEDAKDELEVSNKATSRGCTPCETP